MCSLSCTSGRGTRPPTPRCPRGCRGGLGLHQYATVGGGTEAALQVVVLGLPLLFVHEVAGADLGFISTPLLVAVRKENESGFDVL
jgi:hypothetical protein